ncbi:hypothetical protein, partial [Streptomonospora salina]
NYTKHDEKGSLTRQDRKGARINDAFLNIVSGVEDLADADNDTAFEFIRKRFTGTDGGSPVPLSHHNTYLDQPPAGPEEAVFGIYMTRSPELGLRYSVRASSFPGPRHTTET